MANDFQKLKCLWTPTINDIIALTAAPTPTSIPILTRTPTSYLPKDAPSSKCSYSWHTLNLVWFLALPGSERDRMGDSQSDRQSDSQTNWKPARQTWVSLQKELATWRCKLEPTKGKIKWKTYIVKINYWQAAVSCSGTRRSWSRNRRDAAQTTKTMAKETQRRQRANASCQSW